MSRNKGTRDTVGEQNDRPAVDQEARKTELGRRLDAMGWGLFFLMLGGVWLSPGQWIPGDKRVMAAAIGLGVILIVMSIVRCLCAVRSSIGAMVLGVLILAWGVAGFHGTDLPFFPILFLLIGVGIIASAARRGRGGGCW
ncbi:MAG: hypothetical protein GTN78_12900 [Gemmatimonadales bacterium]|nr:hypothetical protein [Gemmatimonadales bacterium]